MRFAPFVVVTALFALTALVGLAACAGSEQGFTDCSGITCQPGQYCAFPGLCENGCTSDANCAEGQDCADEGAGFNGEGVCVDEDEDDDQDSEPAEGEGEGGDPLEGCIAACARFQDCGMDAGDTASCRNDCPDLTENQQLAVAGCADGSCSDARTCLDIDCFKDDDCPLGEECVGNSCL